MSSKKKITVSTVDGSCFTIPWVQTLNALDHLEDIMFGEINQSEKHKDCVISLV